MVSCTARLLHRCHWVEVNGQLHCPVASPVSLGGGEWSMALLGCFTGDERTPGGRTSEGLDVIKEQREILLLSGLEPQIVKPVRKGTAHTELSRYLTRGHSSCDFRGPHSGVDGGSGLLGCDAMWTGER
jgi:hypothetical protein